MYRPLFATFLSIFTLSLSAAPVERYRLACWDFDIRVYNVFRVSTDFGGISPDGAPYLYQGTSGNFRIYELPDWYSNPNGKYHQRLTIESRLIADIVPGLQTGSVELQSTNKNSVVRNCQVQN